MYMKIAALGFFVGAIALGNTLSAKSAEDNLNERMVLQVKTVPAIDADEQVFICTDTRVLYDVVVSGYFDEDPVLASKCGLIFAQEVSDIDHVHAVYDAIEGEGYLVVLGFYNVTSCGRSYALAYPFTPDPHFTDPELAMEGGVLFHEGYPEGTCTSVAPSVSENSNIMPTQELISTEE